MENAVRKLASKQNSRALLVHTGTAMGALNLALAGGGGRAPAYLDPIRKRIPVPTLTWKVRVCCLFMRIAMTTLRI